MTNAPPDIRLAVGEAPDGKKHLVVSLSGEFPSSQDVVAFLRESGEYLIERGERVRTATNGGE